MRQSFLNRNLAADFQSQILHPKLGEAQCSRFAGQGLAQEASTSPELRNILWIAVRHLLNPKSFKIQTQKLQSKTHFKSFKPKPEAPLNHTPYKPCAEQEGANLSEPGTRTADFPEGSPWFRGLGLGV